MKNIVVVRRSNIKNNLMMAIVGIVMSLTACKSKRDRNHERLLAQLQQENVTMDSLNKIFREKQDSDFNYTKYKFERDSAFRSRFIRAGIEAQSQADAVTLLKEKIILQK